MIRTTRSSAVTTDRGSVYRVPVRGSEAVAFTVRMSGQQTETKVTSSTWRRSSTAHVPALHVCSLGVSAGGISSASRLTTNGAVFS